MTILAVFGGLVFQLVFFGWLYELYGIVKRRSTHRTNRWVYSPGPPILLFLFAFGLVQLLGERMDFLLGGIAGAGMTGCIFGRALRKW